MFRAMSGILRSFICENLRCNAWFDSWASNPACPTCKCVRVSWRPAGGHIGSGAKAADAELRTLADMFKMPDMNSADRGRAAKKVNLPPAPDSGMPAMKFGGGFAAVVDPARARSNENPSGAQCVPTANNINYKVKAGPGSQLAPNKSYPGLRSNTVIEATHKQ